MKNNAETNRIPVIMASVLSEKNLAYRMKADEYLIKPVNHEDLIDCIFRMISKKSGIDVIVADDDENFLSYMKQIFSDESIIPRLTRDGVETLELMESKKADMIILDIIMPQKDGFEVIETIRKNKEWQDTQIIVLTEKDLTNGEKGRLKTRTEIVVRLIEQIIEDIDKNIRVIKAKTGAEAIATARDEAFVDLVLSDISLPDMDGIQIVKELKTYPQFESTPFIAVTAYAGLNDEDTFRQYFEDYVAKPIDEDLLIEKIKKWAGDKLYG